MILRCNILSKVRSGIAWLNVKLIDKLIKKENYKNPLFKLQTDGIQQNKRRY